MTLDEHLKSSGGNGTRAYNALMNHLRSFFPKEMPPFTEEELLKIRAIVSSSMNGVCRVRNLGGKGLDLIASYFGIEAPRRLSASKSVASLVKQLAKAKNEIERLKRGEFICQKCGLRKDAECEKGDF